MTKSEVPIVKNISNFFGKEHDFSCVIVTKPGSTRLEESKTGSVVSNFPLKVAH